ncbi:3-deoxy-7-phosphoheptulonate synthase [Acidimangrovimonas sediminis]|uniref:3-deoxy-7-phosphoheptulonate synthase n=1 Tax=Acidimangrovimonas sediminis TaxID=2056283 RepID=UPI000C801BE2|nr:3-deoxy-7-phosphoheptulonate synthase [Acidimangrovimonas sediminis]
MLTTTDDLRIAEITPLTSPAAILAELPREAAATATVMQGRQAVRDILQGEDDRLLVVIGPCSIHDPAAARDYATRLAEARQRHARDLEIVMRVYFEKPRTTVGWKGLINDPRLDGSCRIEEGLRLARRLLLDINAMHLPAGCEFLDPITPQYLTDLVSWGAIGARTTESQIHRQLASGLSCPVGFKNGTDGNIDIALDAMLSAAQPHRFPAVTKQGLAAIATTQGNADCHVILRGGREPNHSAADVEATARAAEARGLPQRIVIDASHANSRKDPARQPEVVADVCAQLAAGDRRIQGIMIESNLRAGKQSAKPGAPLVYGQSITDGCLDWPGSLTELERLAEAVRHRRAA